MDIQVIVNQMIILFLVMIIGYIANKSGILDQTQNQKMSSLVLNITSPGLILSSVRAPTNGSLSYPDIFNFNSDLYGTSYYGNFTFEDFKSA